MSGGGDFVQRGENDIVKIEINILNLKKFFMRPEDFNGRLVTVVYYEARTFWMWCIYFIYAQIF
jgi:hypothetical protein